MFSVEEVNRRAAAGTPFRDAYRQVGLEIEAGRFTADKHVHHTHEGSIVCLCTAEIAALMQSAYQRFGFDRVARAEQALLEAAAR